METILVNIILIFITLFFVVKHIKYKKDANNQLREHKERIEEEVERRHEVEAKYQSEAHYLKTLEDNQQGNSGAGAGGGNVDMAPLIEEMEVIRKERDRELEIRLETEKNIEITLQKTEDVQKRMDDWQKAQEESLENARDAINHVGIELYEQIISHHKIETEEMRGQIEKSLKNVYSYLEKIVNQVQFLTDKGSDSQNIVGAAISSAMPEEGFGKYSHKQLEAVLKSAGLRDDEYIMQASLKDKRELKSEAAIVQKDGDVMIVDAKASKFFQELYGTTQQSDGEQEDSGELDGELIARIDKYIDEYLLNEKYKQNIIGFLKKNGHLDQTGHVMTVMFLPSENAMAILKRIDAKYIEKLWMKGVIPASPIGLVNLIFHHSAK